VSAPFTCPRCGRACGVQVGPDCVLTLEVVRHLSFEPRDPLFHPHPNGPFTGDERPVACGGQRGVTVCLRCADVLWRRLLKVLEPAMGEATDDAW